MRIVSGSSSEYIYFVALSTSDHVSRVTGLTSFNVYASVNGSTGATYNITVGEVNSTQMPGLYKALIGDSTLTALPAGIDSREVALHITSSMDVVNRTFELYRRTVTTGATLTVNSSGEPTNVMAKLSSMDTTLGAIATKLTSVETNTTGMVVRLTSVDTNVSSILNKVTSIENNTTGMVVRLTSVDTNVSSILNKVTSIEANTTGMVTRLTSVDTNVTSILNKVTSIETNTTGMVVRLTSVDTNVASLLTKLTSVEANTTAMVVQLSSVNTNVDSVLTKATSIDTKATAIQAQTTQFAFTVAGQVDSNIQYVNDVQVQGTGTTVDTWRPV